MYHILICDDEQDIVNALKIYLSNPDFKLYEANTGVQALEVMEQEDIHLILLDIMMPELDGISAMVKIREHSNVPIILLWPRILSVSSLLAVRRIMGTLLCSRIFTMAEMPSISGIMISSRIRWMSSCSLTSSACTPVFASNSLKSGFDRYIFSALTISCSSSQIRMWYIESLLRCLYNSNLDIKMKVVKR